VGRYTATEEVLKCLNTWVLRWAANRGTEGVCPVKDTITKEVGLHRDVHKNCSLVIKAI